MPRVYPLPLVLALAAAFPALADEASASTTILAEEIEGQGSDTLSARGNVQIDSAGRRIEADWVQLFQTDGELRAGEHTRVSEDRNVLEGGRLQLRDSDRTGTMEQPSFRLGSGVRQGRGDAVRLLFDGPGKYKLQQARFTTCAVGDDDWFVRAGQIELDYSRNLGIARNGSVEFKGVPFLYSPYIDFSLDGSRKSGFLAPSFNLTGSGGFDVTLPYYWNIAPQMDATIAPRVIAQRGLLLNNEFRYLGEQYAGKLSAEGIYHDRNFGDNRSALSFQHKQTLADDLVASIDLQKASDDRYFVDFGDRIAVASQTFLPRQASLHYAIPDLTIDLLVQRYQTLQDSTDPVVEPYARLPQLSFNYSPSLIGPVRFDLSGEGAVFKHGTQAATGSSTSRTALNGRRTVLYPSVSLPMEESWGFITPRLGAHLTRYALNDGRELKRDLPVFSLDSGLYFDKQTDWFGNAMIQSLEPRAYYVNIPYKDQSAFPNFDSGVADFNFAQMFSENQYTGGDRVNDANQLTMALTSRLFEAETGIERARFAVGQRFYFDNQKVTLTETARGDDVTASDLIASAGGRPFEDWWMEATWQYDQQARSTSKSAFNVRYQPLPGSSINLGYRFDRLNDIKQGDISAQWPLTRRLNAVARYYWSIPEQRALETIAGLEYNGGCWVFRAVNQRYVTTSNETSRTFFLQLELNDLSRIGSNPLQTLKDSIPGYTKLN